MCNLYLANFFLHSRNNTWTERIRQWFLISVSKVVFIVAGCSTVIYQLYKYCTRKIQNDRDQHRSNLASKTNFDPQECKCPITGLIPCTCDESEHLGVCEKHDRILFWELSNKLSRFEDLLNLGVYLGVDERLCKENSSTIPIAVFDMLYYKWYKSQDLDKLQKVGLKDLCDVLRHKNVGKNILVGSVINKHFNNRPCTPQ